VEVLQRCGDDLTRANVMKQATSLNTKLPTARREAFDVADRPAPDETDLAAAIDGERWQLFGDVVDVTK
jgi:branched-chain amino acid transport system substrate-binding protein